MSANLVKILLTAAGVISAGANVIPGLPPVAGMALSALSGFLVGWAHMKKPGTP